MGPGPLDRSSPTGRPRRPALLMRNGNGVAREVLGGTCGWLGDSCGHPELPRRDADKVLGVLAELALVREAGTGGDLRQGEVTVSLRELLRPLDAHGSNGRILSKSRGPIGSPRPGSCCRITCISLRGPGDRTHSSSGFQPSRAGPRDGQGSRRPVRHRRGGKGPCPGPRTAAPQPPRPACRPR
jgi:hypothetical protein